jgi:hypothetical protein
LVVLNPADTKHGLDIRETLKGKFGYEVLSTERFYRDKHYLRKGVYFRKDLARYRLEVFELFRGSNK